MVAVIGDGSMTGGMAFEGLNNLGHSGRKAIIILNDNGRSYAPTVSKLTESMARVRINPQYRRQRARLEQLIDRMPMADQLQKGLDATMAALREYFEPRAFFEDLGVNYTGPFDGHDIEGLERALRHAAEEDGPIVVHVVTEKGRGYAPAEPTTSSGSTTRPTPSRAATRPPSPRRSARPARTTPPGGHHRRHARLHRPAPVRRAVPGRLIDVGIAEQHAVTSAAGMAMGGCGRSSPSTPRSSPGRSTR